MMMMLKGICLLVAFTTVLCQVPIEEEIRSGSTLKFREIRQVMRDDDPSGENHNIKVVITSHLSLQNIAEWSLMLMKNDRDTVTYTTKGDGKNPTSQTEFIFEGNLLETDSLALLAKNTSAKLVAGAYAVADIKDLKSNVAWVGDYATSNGASLRVRAGSLLGEVMVAKDVCETADSPCYYVTPKPKPTAFERCYDIPDTTIKHCDDRVISFNAPSELPEVFLRDDKTLEVEFTFKSEKFVIEVLAYDPYDHLKLFSESPFRCLFPIGATWNDGDKMTCRHALTLPEGQKEMAILIVKLQNDRVTESSLVFFGEVITITRFEKTDDETKFLVCQDKSSTTPFSNIQPWILVKYEGDKDEEVFDADSNDDVCITFNGDITSLSSQTNLNFFLIGGNEDQVVIANTKITTFPEFASIDLTISQANDPIGDGTRMLRVEGSMGSLELEDFTNKIENVPGITYYVDIDPLIPDSLYLCKSTEPNGVNVCQKAGSAIPAPTPETSDLAVTSAVLTYAYESSAAKALDPELSQVSVTATSTGSTRMEIIVTDDTKTKLCSGVDMQTTLSCPISWSDYGEEIVQIRVIGITNSLMKETISNPIQDRGMTITVLEEDIVEGSWLMHSDPPPEAKNYGLTLKTEDSINDKTTVDVNCTHISLPRCFGYFPNKDSGTYTLAVKNKLNDTPLYNETQEIESERRIIPSGPSQHLQIHVLPMEFHQNLMEVNTTICFNHETPNEEMIFSHYEMLLINTRGQWLKHKVMEEDNNDDVLCFTPFTINTQEFDVTEGVKVVVSQRASDGFSVIASGGSPLFYT